MTRHLPVVSYRDRDGRAYVAIDGMEIPSTQRIELVREVNGVTRCTIEFMCEVGENLTAADKERIINDLNHLRGELAAPVPGP